MEVAVEEVVPETVVEAPQISQETQALRGEEALQLSREDVGITKEAPVVDTVTDEEKIITDYFDHAYDR